MAINPQKTQTIEPTTGNGKTIEVPPVITVRDLANLMKKAQNLAVHLDKNKKDLHNKRAMQNVEARIHKLSRYYKRKGVLPAKWKYETKVATIS